MRAVSSCTRWLVFCLLGLIGLVVAPAGSAPNQPVFDYRLGQADAGPGPMRPIGSPAPDMTLPRLSSYVAREGKPPVGMTTLSAYRGKRVVVLILTGYT